MYAIILLLITNYTSWALEERSKIQPVSMQLD